MQCAEVLVRARLGEGILVHEALIVKNSGITVHVIGRTKLFVGYAGCATGDAVHAARPSPPHGIACRDVDGIRHKTEFVSYWTYSHIENLTTDIPFAGWRLVSVLIKDADRNRMILVGYFSVGCVTGFCGPEVHGRE